MTASFSSALARALGAVFDIRHDGTLTHMRKFTDWGGDGMSMDERGNVYISNGEGVMAFDRNGNNILKISIADGATNGLKLTQKGRRKGQELGWEDLISGQAALAVALNASLASSQ
jgi:gluconolactonase